jgi:hypothetical protein
MVFLSHFGNFLDNTSYDKWINTIMDDGMGLSIGQNLPSLGSHSSLRSASTLRTPCVIEDLLHAKWCNAKLTVFWWLFFVAFWRGNTFVRYEEEEGYKNEFTSCLHAHVCCIVSCLGSSWCCFLGLVLDLVLGLQILPPHPPLVRWNTSWFLLQVLYRFLGGGYGVAESTRFRLP